MSKVDRLNDIEEKTRKYLKALEKYPHKEISEYSRLVSQLETFLLYGHWSRHED